MNTFLYISTILLGRFAFVDTVMCRWFGIGLIQNAKIWLRPYFFHQGGGRAAPDYTIKKNITKEGPNTTHYKVPNIFIHTHLYTLYHTKVWSEKMYTFAL